VSKYGSAIHNLREGPFKGESQIKNIQYFTGLLCNLQGVLIIASFNNLAPNAIKK
jgi:hypothetical protein